jgi:hypothetical protein
LQSKVTWIVCGKADEPRSIIKKNDITLFFIMQEQRVGNKTVLKSDNIQYLYSFTALFMA